VGISVIESAGAVIPARQTFVDPHTDQVLPQSAQSRTPRSFMTAIRADIGEAEAYKQALLRGEIGLQRPMGSNVAGVDFITALRVGPNGIGEILCTDVKTSGRGRFPRPKNIIPGNWLTEMRDATTHPRLRLLVTATDVSGVTPFPIPDSAGLQRLEAAIVQAVAAGHVRLRQLNADYSPAGQGGISGW
jgi:hypothetical protein